MTDAPRLLQFGQGGRAFEELDYWPTPLGPLSLRRRWVAEADAHAFEIKLGDAFLMSSLFTVSEIALADLGLAATDGESLSVVVGGLGLGATARAALADERVREMLVVEYLDGVIAWHQEGLLPDGPALLGDPRCRVVEGDFFAMAASDVGFDGERPGRRFDAILLDIDHTPDERLGAPSEGFYSPAGLSALARHLRPGGVFALWSDVPPDTAFTARLRAVFAEAWAEAVTFHNPLLRTDEVQTVYLARTAR